MVARSSVFSVSPGSDLSGTPESTVPAGIYVVRLNGEAAAVSYRVHYRK